MIIFAAVFQPAALPRTTCLRILLFLTELRAGDITKNSPTRSREVRVVARSSLAASSSPAVGSRPGARSVGDCFDNASFFRHARMRAAQPAQFQDPGRARTAPSISSKAGTTPVGAIRRSTIIRRPGTRGAVQHRLIAAAQHHPPNRGNFSSQHRGFDRAKTTAA